MKLYEFIKGFARVYPLLTYISTFFMFFFTNDIDLLFFTLFIFINEISNHILKQYIFRPVMKNKKLDILGYGKRPNEAKYCNLFITKGNGKPSKSSYGMPSGHSQNAVFFSTYIILNMMDTMSNNFTRMIGMIIFILLPLGIMYSRVYFKCHTIEQVIIGGLFGFLISNLCYNNKEIIKNYINLRVMGLNKV
tara:strand:- start:484 stop:1059 length:576 start_codon:yes stop_codon:yes gene_type:complete